MKLKSLLLGAATAFALSSSVQADALIRVTGATAFRESAHKGILSAFTSCNYGYVSGNFGNANQAVFVGSFPGITGTTTVKTSWSGSIEGIKAIVLNTTEVAKHLPNTGFTPALTSGTGTGTANLTNALADEVNHKIAFSDAAKTATPYASSTFTGGRVGVITFAAVGSPNLPSGLNITQKQFQTLFRTGFLDQSFLTGLAADVGKFVFATGRNDGSGTRTIYLSEANVGDSDVAKSYRALGVEQYKILSTGTASTIQRWPTGDGNNASTIWVGDLAGNGGYSSGSTLRGLMDDTLSATVQVLDDLGDPSFAAPVSMITAIATADAATIITNGGKFLSWNGSTITPLTAALGGLSADDKLKVAYGQYTFWSYEHMYGFDVASGIGGEVTGADLGTFFTNIFGKVQLATNIGGNGLTLGEMFVERSEEGAQVTDKP